MYRAVVLPSEMYTHLVPDRRIRATIKSRLDERIRTNTLTAIRNMNKVTESIGDRVGGYNFLPALFTFGSRRKQCPLYSVNSESSLLDCAGSEGYSKDWSPSSVRARQHKPNDSTRIGTGQSSCRGRVRCQSLFIAGERRRCEPGSNSVIVTAPFTRCEGHVASLGGLQRTRKIFVGCPAIRPIWDQSPGRTASRFETVGNRLYPLHDQDCLRRFTAEAQIQDRSRKSTGLNTAPGFLRVRCPFREAKGARKPKRPQNRPRGMPPRTPPSFPRRRAFPRRREPREKQSTPLTPFAKRKGARAERAGDAHADAGNPEKNKARRLPPFAQPKRTTTGPKRPSRRSDRAGDAHVS